VLRFESTRRYIATSEIIHGQQGRRQRTTPAQINGRAAEMATYLGRTDLAPAYQEQSRAARGWLGWSQAELAKRAYVSLRTVQGFEKGEKAPTPPMLLQCAGRSRRRGSGCCSVQMELLRVSFARMWSPIYCPTLQPKPKLRSDARSTPGSTRAVVIRTYREHGRGKSCRSTRPGSRISARLFQTPASGGISAYLV
jgi:hypothetical protein